MPNENLKDALIAAGMSLEEFADTIQVDPRTVERWVAGRTPYRRHRTTISRALRIPAHELWPETTPAPESTATSDGEDRAALNGDRAQPPDTEREAISEVVATWGRSNATGTPTATRFLEGTRKQIDVLDGAMNLIGNHGVIDALRVHAATGAEVRVLVNAATPELHDLARVDRVEVRVRDARTAHALLRADDHALLSLRLAHTGIPPLLRLTRHGEDGLFDRLTEHFDTWWQHSEPLLPAPSEPPASERLQRRWPGRRGEA